MARVPIISRNSPGQVNDTPAVFLPPEAWTTALNVRFRNGVAQRIGGSVALAPDVTPEARQLFPFKPYNLDPHLLICAPTEVNISDGTTTTDITGASVPNAPDNGWTFTNFNGIPILNEGTVRPQALTTIPGGPLINLPNWPATYLCKAMRSFKNFLVALNITKAGTNYPNLVLWSNVADPGTVPNSWDITDPATLAGENPIASNDDDDDNEVVDGAQLKDMFIIYKHLTATVMVLGGQNVFSFSKTLDKGVMSRNCILRPPIKESKHAVFGLEDIYLHNGFTEESILEDRMRKWLFDRIEPTMSNLCHAAHNRRTGECWFMYPEIGAASGQVTHALVWNYKKNNVSIVELPSTYSIACGAFALGSVEDTWEDDDLGWEDDDIPWNALAASALQPRFLQAQTTGLSAFDESAPARSAVLERLGLAIAGRDQAGQPIYDTDGWKLCRGVWPRFEGTGVMTVTVGGSDTPDGAITWGPAKQFNVTSQSKVDVTARGRILHVRFEAVDTGQWRFLGYDLEIEAAGAIT